MREFLIPGLLHDPTGTNSYDKAVTVEEMEAIVKKHLKNVHHDPPVFRAISRSHKIAPSSVLSDVIEHSYYVRIAERQFWIAFMLEVSFEVMQLFFASAALGCESGWNCQLCGIVGNNTFTFVVLFFVWTESVMRIVDAFWTVVLRNVRDGDQVYLHTRICNKDKVCVS